MKIVEFPPRSQWPQILARPQMETRNLEQTVSEILEDVRINGDEAVKQYTTLFDKAELDRLDVSPEEFEAAEALVSLELKKAIETARQNIFRFHEAQKTEELVVETMPGVKCWQRSLPIEKVGLYVPGGTAPLFSTVLMLGVPAVIAGCKEIVLCSPPGADGRIHPAILYAAQAIGITRVFKVGGVQAIGAMAFGTETIPQVFKIFGPGNQFVTAAKQLVSRLGTAIDMPAGPSEVLVCADHSAVPAYVASDLLSQAEHGQDSQVVLVAFDKQLIENVQAELEAQLQTLPRQAIARQALSHSVAILVKDKKEAIEVINAYAPEHLILALEDAAEVARQIANAGSVFLGNYTPESVGDYASGTNHTLPTYGFARAFSGVTLDSFQKKITFQQLTREGLELLGPTVETMAEAEELEAHKQAVRIRLQSISSPPTPNR